MEFQTVLSNRFTVRQYQNTPVSQADIDAILEVVRTIPTAGNAQSHRVKVLQTEEDLERVDSCTTCRYGAPCVFLVCADTSRAYVRAFDEFDAGMMDATVASTYLMLKATELGLNTTWVIYFDPTEVKKMFYLPTGVVPVTMIMVGTAAENVLPAEEHFTRNDLQSLLL